MSDKKLRSLKNKCKSKFCEKCALRHCSYFSEDIRKEIFDLFWKMTCDQKRHYVTNLIECSTIQPSTVENSNTKYNFLKHNSNRIKMCAKMFLSTLGVSEKMVFIALK